MNRTVPAIAAMLSALLAANSHAASSASVTFSDIKVTLSDMDPGDGVAPSVTFAGFSTALGQTFDPASSYPGFTENFGASFFGPVAEVAPSTSFSTASSFLTGDAMGAGAIAHAEAVDNDAAAAQTLSAASIRLFGRGGLQVENADFVLSPHTSLTVSGKFDSTVSSTDALNEAVAQVSLQFFDAASPDQPTSVFASADTTLLPRGTYTSERELNISFINDSSSAVFGYFQADIVAAATSGIPETSTLSMTGAGLALALSAVLCRRLRSGR